MANPQKYELKKGGKTKNLAEKKSKKEKFECIPRNPLTKNRGICREISETLVWIMGIEKIKEKMKKKNP